MNTEDFLDILEQRDLVPSAVVDSIREKAQHGKHRITAKSVLKFLVKREMITRRQAKQLLETTLTVTSHAESSILGFVPIPKAPAAKEPRQQVPVEEEIPTLAPIETDESASVLDEPEGSTIGEMTAQEELGSFVSESISAAETFSPSESYAAATTAGNVLPEKSKPTRKKQKKKNEWDSPLLLLGGGGLVVLLVVGVTFSVMLNREDADTILAEAGEYFEGGSYTQAINQYERFVEKFSKHPQYSRAKVRLGMARLWKATSGTSRYAEALETAQQVLDDLKNEPDFQTAQRDLASLLPDIAEGLAQQAAEAEQPAEVEQRLEQTEVALALCANTKYIPKTFRDEVVLGEIGQTLRRVRRGQQQKNDLEKALGEIQVAIDDRDIAKAYRIHRKLLAETPGLLNNAALARKVEEISAAEKLVVKYVAEPRVAETSPRSSQIVASLALAERRGQPVVGEEGTLAVRVEGAVYGLNRSDGALLWRKFVGFDARSTPLRLPDGDVLVVDAAHHELLRLKGDSGHLVWRLSLDGPLLRPVSIGELLLVAERSGKLHVVDPADGTSAGYVEFGQALAVPPTVGKAGKRIYVVGDHSSLFTLSAEDFSCLGAFYLGHEQGSLTTPLVATLNKVVAAVNTGGATSQLRVLATDQDGLLTEITTTRRQDGLINTRLLVAGRRLIALTSSGQIVVYEVGTGQGDEALTTIASRDAQSGPPIARFGLVHDGHVWAAGAQLNKLAILPTGNRLPVRTLDRDYQGDTFDYPLQMAGKLLIHVRHPANQAGVVVVAMDPAAGQTRWETELAVPPAGAPGIDLVGKRIVAATASGATYLLNRQSMSRRVQDQAERLSGTDKPIPLLTASTDLGQGRLAMVAYGSDTLLHFRPEAPRGSLRAITLAGPVSSDPVPWGEGFVVTTQVGQVFLFDREGGQQLGSPFQPPLVPGAKYRWLTPGVYGSGEGARLVLSDGIEKIYLLAKVAQPEPHLAAEVETELGQSPLNTRLAVVGNLVCAGTEAGQLALFQLPSLKAEAPVDLGSQVRWGPFAVGDQVLFSTGANELVCLDAQAQIVWRQPLEHGLLTGVPLANEGKVLLLWQAGGLSRLELSGGTEVAHVQLDQPVVAGPVPFGKRVVVSASDGTLLVVNRP